MPVLILCNFRSFSLTPSGKIIRTPPWASRSWQAEKTSSFLTDSSGLSCLRLMGIIYSFLNNHFLKGDEKASLFARKYIGLLIQIRVTKGSRNVLGWFGAI